MQPGDLIVVRRRPDGVLPDEVLLWIQDPAGHVQVAGRTAGGELLVFLGPGAENTVRVLHPVHGVRLMHWTYARSSELL